MSERVAFITGVTGQDGAYLAELLLGKGLKAGPLEVVGSDMPLGLGSPAKEAVCDTVQSLRGSKPGTGTAVDISLPSIRNTRPCDADSRTFNAS